MYIRQVSRKNKDGSTATYVQLAHNQRGDSGASVAEILYNFGRKEQIDIDGLKRLVASIERFLASEAPPSAKAKDSDGEDLRLLDSRPMGAAWLLRGLWDQLGIGRALSGLAAKRGKGQDPTGAIFAMAANRALDPTSKHAIHRSSDGFRQSRPARRSTAPSAGPRRVVTRALGPICV